MSAAQGHWREGKGGGKDQRGKGKGSRGGKGGGHAVGAGGQSDALSKELGSLLRHKGVSGIRPDGYAPMDSVLAALRSQPTRDSVEAVVRGSRRTGGQARFEITEFDGVAWIRATDKHSLSIVGGTGQAEDHRPQVAVDVEKLRAAAERKQAEAAVQSQRMGKSRSEKIDKVLGQAKSNFDATANGPEYISLKQGEELTLHRHVDVDTGWAFGSTAAAEGWFPATLWEPLPGASPSVSSTGVPSSPTRRDEKQLLEELQAAREEIAKLKAELQAEKSVSAGLRRQLESRAADSKEVPSKSADWPELQAARKKTSAVPPGDGSYKELLIEHLSKAFPKIKNEGLDYDVFEMQQDAKGSYEFKARVSHKELGSAEGAGSSKQEAEQMAALSLLHDLGGLQDASRGAER
eukprot:TRINITY_DN42756_c0_g1_i1.p1 TRINITY_DN42756_c0_g1~~TRINITY_DN42756_c0_g1_i1.p1  ORF type:complete len:406 (-),score=90.49 TRINITY_DN42756_c0_g1_i1:27-1244(-)